MIKIAILTPKNSYNYIKEALDSDIFCEKSYIFYEDLKQLEKIYFDIKDGFDAIITSGPIGYEIIKKNVHVTTPVYYFEIQQYELYKFLLKILLENRNLNFSNVCVDFLRGEYLTLLKDTFSNEEIPTLINLDYSDVDLYKSYKEKFYQLNSQRKIDLVLTRMSNMTPFFKEINKEYRFIFPSKESLNETLEKIVQEIKLKTLENKKIVIGTIYDLNKTSLVKSYFKNKLKDFVVYEFENSLEILTLKDNFFSYIEEILELRKENIDIGWGCSANIVESRYYSQEALKENIKNFNKKIYIFEDRNKFLLNNFSSNQKIDKKIFNIFEELNLDNTTIKVLIQLFYKKEDLNSEKLATYLNMSKRNASRILLKLESKNIAISKIKKISRGRPLKLFQLNFI